MTYKIPDLRKETEKRIILLSKAKDSKELQEIEKELCKRDILYFCRNYLYTDKNTNLFSNWETNIIPFIPFPFQEECITEIWSSIINWTKPINERIDFTNVFIEKSRQMGLSWLIVAIYVYWFIFYNHKYLLISQKENDVDKKWDMKSLFEKIRFILKNIPNWLLPVWFGKNSWSEYNKYMSVNRPDWSWSITWESANQNASRWWTYQSVFMDEMAFMQNATAINTAAASATPCRLFNSTPNWEWNEFFRMKEYTINKQLSDWIIRKAEIKWLRYHWSEHPLYDTEWYNWKIKWMSKEKIAQELEIDYNTAVIWRVYDDFPKKPTFLTYDYNKPLYVILDNSHWWTDPNAIIILQPEGVYWNILDAIELTSTPQDCAEYLTCQPKFQMNTSQEKFLERYKQYNWRKAIFIADPYDTKSAMWNSTILDDYKKVWINLMLPQERRKEEQILKTRTNVYRIRYNDNCLDFASAIMNAKYPERKETSQSTKAFTLPVHNWTSHYRTALEYFVTYFLENPILIKNKVIRDTRPKRDKVTWKLIFAN